MNYGNAFGQSPFNFQGMAGPQGFGGTQPPMLGQNFLQGLQQDPNQQQHHGHGMNPMMMLSPLMALLGSGGGKAGLGMMISPLAAALGAFK